MKPTRLILCLSLATLVSGVAHAELVGPYTPDPNTLFLLHFDEPSGSTSALNVGSKGGTFYSVANSISGNGLAAPPSVTTMLGASSYVNGPTNFGTCMTNSTPGYLFGYDYNSSSTFDPEVSGTVLSPDRLGMTNLNIGNGGKTPFTLEAVIRPLTNGAGQASGEIICTDNSLANSGRGFQFRLAAGNVQFQAIAPSQAISGTIPTTGPHALVSGEWYHVAMTYDGTTATIYWTKLDPSYGAANVLSSSVLNLSNNFGVIQGPLIIGNENRNSSQEHFLGCIDEVRISSVCRAPNQMQFYSPRVTLTQNPGSQNVDYNQPVNFMVGASSLTPLSYQWRFNSNDISGATSSAYSIPNVAAGDAGYYDVIVTNTAGYGATSAPAHLVVGAANFLTHRYSFATDTSDSVGGAWGTNFGTAAVTGGKLVLDGTADGYMQLPANLFTSATASALTFEFWATFGANTVNSRVFDFGVTGVNGNGFNYVAFSPNTAAGHQLLITPGDVIFQQVVSGAGTLDGLTRHIACVVDPPNKSMSIYTNGVLESVNTNMTVNIANLNNAISYIGKSLFTNGTPPYLNAAIDEFRIYSGALSGISLKQSDDQGPNTVLADGPAEFITQPANVTVPVGQTASFAAAAVGYLPITYQWFKSGALVPGATDATYSFPAAIGDNGATLVCWATNTVGVTTYVTNSATATLSVFVPPTLAWMDSANGGADSFWNTTSLNWNNGSSIVAFAQTNGVLFDSRGSGFPTVDVTEPVTPYNITANASTDYLITSSALGGSLNGQGGIIKQNSGKLTIDLTNNLSGPVTITGGTLQIGNGTSSGSLGIGVVTNNATLAFNRADNALSVPNIIHGSGVVRFDGTGATTISGANDYTGSTLLNAGIVYLTSSSGLGSTNSGTSVANGAQLYVTANVNLEEGLTLNGPGDGNGALRKGGAGATTNYSPILLASDSTVTVDGGATLDLNNAVSGTAVLTAGGTGTLRLNASNSFTGGFTLNGSVVNVNVNGALGPGPITVSGAGRLVIGTGLSLPNPLTANATTPGVGAGLIMVADNTNGTVTTVSGPLTFNVSPANGGTFVGPGSSGYLNISGPVTNTATGVVTSRAGNVRFSGGGEYTTLTVGQGVVSLGAQNGISQSATVNIGASGPGTLDLNGYSQALAGLTDGGANAKLVTNGAPTPSLLTLNIPAGSAFSGVIAGNLGLVKNDVGVLTLSGTNAYTGNTTVNGGTLQIAVASLAVVSTVSVSNGAVLQLDFMETNKVSALLFNGISQAPGLYNAGTSSTYITGWGNLLVSPVATNPTNIATSVTGTNLTLSWPTDHTGWRLLVQTNNLVRGISTNPADWGVVSGSANTNQVIIPIDPGKPTEFYRLVYP